MIIASHIISGSSIVLGVAAGFFGLHQFFTRETDFGDEYLVQVIPNVQRTDWTKAVASGVAQQSLTPLTSPTKDLVSSTGDVNEKDMQNYACAAMINQEYQYDENCVISTFAANVTQSLSSRALLAEQTPVHDAAQFQEKNLFTIKSATNTLKSPYVIYVVPNHEPGQPTPTTITKSWATLNVVSKYSRKSPHHASFSGKYNFILGYFYIEPGQTTTINASSSFTCKRDFDSVYQPCDLYKITTQPDNINNYLLTDWNTASKVSSTAETPQQGHLYLIHLKYKYWIREEQPRGGLFQVKITNSTPPPPSPQIKQFISISPAIGEVDTSSRPKLFLLT